MSENHGIIPKAGRKQDINMEQAMNCQHWVSLPWLMVIRMRLQQRWQRLTSGYLSRRALASFSSIYLQKTASDVCRDDCTAGLYQ